MRGFSLLALIVSLHYPLFQNGNFREAEHSYKQVGRGYAGT